MLIKKNNILYVKTDYEIVEVKEPFYVKEEIGHSICVGHNNSGKYYYILDSRYSLFLFGCSIGVTYLLLLSWPIILIVKYFIKKIVK